MIIFIIIITMYTFIMNIFLSFQQQQQKLYYLTDQLTYFIISILNVPNTSYLIVDVYLFGSFLQVQITSAFI
jgi:hypothetical protein